MRRIWPVLAVWLLSLSSLPSLAKKRAWVEVSSPHFEVISNGSAKEARQVATGFEQMRAIFAEVSKLRVASGAQTIVLAPRDERTMKELVPMYWQRRGQMHPAGLFGRGWERDYAIVRLDEEGYEYSTVYHEYIHKLLHLNFPRLPSWLDEGLAEFYGTAQIRKDKAILGMPSPRVQVLQEKPPYPLEKLLAAGPGSPYYTQADKAQMFYAESWGLTHYLMFGQGMGKGQRMNQYLARLQHGDDALEAFKQVFGDLRQVQAQFEGYVRRFTFWEMVLRHSIDVGERNFLVREMSPAETDAELGGFYVYFGEQETAERLLQEAIAAQPALASAHENMAFLYFDRGEDDQAEKEFSTTLQLNPADSLALYYQTMLLNYHAGASFTHPDVVDTKLQQVLRLNPKFAPALVVQSRIYVQEHRLGEALQSALRGQQLEPDRAGYALNVARILLLMGDKAQAADIAVYVARRWWGSDRAEALDLLKQAQGSDSSRSESLPGLDYAQGTVAVAGVVESVTCAKSQDQKQDMQLVLRTDGGLVTFHGRTFNAGFSDTLWWGADHFSICHHLAGVGAVVRFKPGTDRKLPQELVSLEIRDNLPPALANPKRVESRRTAP